MQLHSSQVCLVMGSFLLLFAFTPREISFEQSHLAPTIPHHIPFPPGLANFFALLFSSLSPLHIPLLSRLLYHIFSSPRFYTKYPHFLTTNPCLLSKSSSLSSTSLLTWPSALHSFQLLSHFLLFCMSCSIFYSSIFLLLFIVIILFYIHPVSVNMQRKTYAERSETDQLIKYNGIRM